MRRAIKILIVFVCVNIFVCVYNLFFAKKVLESQIVLGWPYIFYRQFDLKGKDSIIYGWDIRNFFIDQIIYLTISLFFVLMFHRSYQKKVVIK